MKIDKHFNKETYLMIDGMCNFLMQIFIEEEEGIDIEKIPEILAEQLAMLLPVIRDFKELDYDITDSPLGFSNAVGELSSRLTFLLMDMKNYGTNFS